MAGVATRRPVILVVDDDPSLRDALGLILGDRYEVVEAPDALTAQAILGSAAVDLILLDILLAGIDGITFLERLRALGKLVPVVIVSAIDAAAVAATAMRLGAVDYVTKPFDDGHLLSVVDVALDPAARNGPSAFGRRPPRILVVGGDAGLVATISVALSRAADVDTACTSEDLARYAERGRPDVAVVDLSDHTIVTGDLVPVLDSAFAGERVVIMGARSSVGAPRRAPHCTTLWSPVRIPELFAHIGRALPAEASPLPYFSPPVIGIFEHVRTRFATVTVQALGSVVGRSPYNLSRRFHDETGMTVKTFVNRVRIGVARQLLRRTSEKIESVAARVGLHDGSHLSRLFLKYDGVRPSHAR